MTQWSDLYGVEELAATVISQVIPKLTLVPFKKES